MSNENEQRNNQRDNLPIASNEDVEFSMDQADEDDLEALARADAAERRQQEN